MNHMQLYCKTCRLQWLNDRDNYLKECEDTLLLKKAEAVREWLLKPEYLDGLISKFIFKKKKVTSLKFGEFLPIIPLRTLTGDPTQVQDLAKEMGMDPRTPWWRIIGPACQQLIKDYPSRRQKNLISRLFELNSF